MSGNESIADELIETSLNSPLSDDPAIIDMSPISPIHDPDETRPRSPPPQSTSVANDRSTGLTESSSGGDEPSVVPISPPLPPPAKVLKRSPRVKKINSVAISTISSAVKRGEGSMPSTSASLQQEKKRGICSTVPQRSSPRNKSFVATTNSLRDPQQEHHRIVYHHRHGFLVLSVDPEKQSYTLTNGAVSCCEQRNRTWMNQLVADIRMYKASRLFVVDEVTKTQWKKVQDQLKDGDPLKRLYGCILRDSQRHLGLCQTCEDPKCTRLKAIVGGVQRLIPIALDMIPH